MNNICDPAQTYLLACSGGVDSCVLFDMLLQAKYNFMVVHFNHQTRGADHVQEQALITKMCEKNKIPLFVYQYFHKRGNFQAQARAFRLKIYQQLITEKQLSGVILAHHGDDQIENILMNPEKIGPVLMTAQTKINNINIYRPLLHLYKSDLYTYAKKHNIKFYEDRSNTELKYKRNFYRQMHSFSKADKDLLLKTQIDQEQLIQSLAQSIGKELDAHTYQNAADQILLLYLFIKQDVPKNVSRNLLLTISNALDFNGYKTINLPDNYLLIQDYQRLKIKKQQLKTFVTRAPLQIGINNFNGVTFLNTTATGYIRTRQPGDRIKYSYGTKKVSRLMIDLKISQAMRAFWPIVVSEQDQILYIPNVDKK